jgi:hypothetical protein
LFIDTLANNKNAAMGYAVLIENGIRIGEELTLPLIRLE